MKAVLKNVLLMVPGLLLAGLAGSSILVLPNFLRAHIKRPWLYNVDIAPLDLRLLFLSLLLIALSTILIILLLHPYFQHSSRRKVWMTLSLGGLLLVPLKNGSVSHSLFFSLAGLASVLIWKATGGWQERSERFLRKVGQSLMRVSSLRWQISILMTGWLFYLATASFLFDRIPQCMDETDYLFQAKIFARGKLWAPSTAAPAFFHLVNMINKDGKWMSQHPPGWPALLSLGVRVGAPWMINPLLGGLILLFIYQLAREVFGEEVARISSLLSLFSPYLIAINSSMMAHTSCALGALLFLLNFERGISRSSSTRMFLAALFLGTSALIRPFTAFLLALPSAGLLGWELIRSPRPTLKLALASLFGLVIPLALLFTYNFFTTGSAWLFGYQYLHGQSNTLGFGPRQYPYPHTWLEGLRICHSRLLAVSQNLFQSAVPALAMAVSSLAFRRLDRKIIWLGLTFLALPLGYIFHFSQDFYYEPRYLFESSGALIILCALGLNTVRRRWLTQKALPHYGFILIVLALFVFIPAHLLSLRRAGDLGPELKEMIHEQNLTDSIVFIDPLYYPMGMMLQSPFLDGDNIYVRNLPGRSHEILDRYPHRPAYLFFRDPQSWRFRLIPYPLQPD
jgi:hypothetical protein